MQLAELYRSGNQGGGGACAECKCVSACVVCVVCVGGGRQVVPSSSGWSGVKRLCTVGGQSGTQVGVLGQIME